MVRPTRHVGAGLRGLLGPTAHGLLGRRHPGPCLSRMVGWGWGLRYRDSQIFVRGLGMCWVTYGYGVWGSLVPLFSPHPKKIKRLLGLGVGISPLLALVSVELHSWGWVVGPLPLGLGGWPPPPGIGWLAPSPWDWGQG